MAIQRPSGSRASSAPRTPVAHAQRLRHADVRTQRIGDAEPTQDARAVGADLDAGAVLVKSRPAFQHVRGDAVARQRQRGGEAADAAAGDEHRSGRALARPRQGRFGVLVGLRVEL